MGHDVPFNPTPEMCSDFKSTNKIMNDFMKGQTENKIIKNALFNKRKTNLDFLKRISEMVNLEVKRWPSKLAIIKTLLNANSRKILNDLIHPIRSIYQLKEKNEARIQAPGNKWNSKSK